MFSGRKPGNQNTVNENIYTGSEIAARGKKNEHKIDEELVPVGTTSRQTHMCTRTHKHINHVLRNWYYITSPKISCAMKLKRTHIKHTTKDT